MKICLHLALAYLKKQKGRTFALVTGVALSVMLVFGFNIINESQSRMQLANIYKLYGSYHATFSKLDNIVAQKLEENKNISEMETAANLGNIVDHKGISLKLNSSDENFIKKHGYKLKKGHLPTKQGEIVLESQALKKMGLKEELNQIIDLQIKKEYTDENNINKIFINKQSFKVVGITEKPSQYYEDWYWLMAFTFFEDGGANVIPNNLVNYDGIVNLKSGANKIDKSLNDIRQKYNIGRLNFEPNTKLVTALSDYSSAQNNESNDRIKLLVITTAVLLIYNLFNISLTEMIKQIGMLRTVGVSKKYVRSIVMLQSLVILILGVVSGLLIGILFSYLGMKIFNFTGTIIDTSKSQVYISKNSLLDAVKVGTITVIISSIVPICIAGRISPLEALRKIDKSGGSQKARLHHKLIRRIFGISGEMAYKNVWRNKFTAIISILSISMGGILFIHTVASVKSDWRSNTNSKVAKMQDNTFKLSYGINIDENLVGYTDKDIRTISSIDGVKSIKTKTSLKGFLQSDTNDLQDEYKKYNGISDKHKNVETALEIKAYDDKQLNEFEKYINKGSLSSLNDQGEYTNAIVFNYYYDILNDHTTKEVRENLNVGDIISLKIPTTKEGITSYEYHKVRIVALLDSSWLFKGDSTRGRYFEVIIPSKQLSAISGKSNYSQIALTTEEKKNNHIYKELNSILKSKPFAVMESKLQYKLESEHNIQQNLKSKMIIVILMLLIAGLNILFTIRTNLLIRTNEFATLRAIGMTVKQIKSMIIKESIVYGFLSSIIAAVLGSYRSYRFMEMVNAEYKYGFNLDNVATFNIPIVEILQFSIISVITCIIVVYISKRKIEKLSIIEGLRTNE